MEFPKSQKAPLRAQSSVCYHQLSPMSREDTSWNRRINQQLNRTILHWKAFRWNNDLYCLFQNTSGSTSCARSVTQPRPGSAARSLQSLGKHSTDAQNSRQSISQVRSSFSVHTPLDFASQVLILPQWFVLPPSAVQFHLLQEEEFCLKPHQIQTDVTAESNHLLRGMRKGSRVKLILHFQLTNLECGCQGKSINSRIYSSKGRGCAARTAPAVSEGLGSQLTLRAAPRATSAAPLVLMVTTPCHTQWSQQPVQERSHLSSGHHSGIQSFHHLLQKAGVRLPPDFLPRGNMGEKKQVCISYSEV